MFLWVKVNTSSKTSDEMFEQLASSGVVTVSGEAFRVPNEFLGADASRDGSSGAFLRLSFANATPASMQAAVHKMSEILSL
jgi:DNA-binding transcriptional MocR family regulator